VSAGGRTIWHRPGPARWSWRPASRARCGTVAALFDVLRARTTTIRIANARIYQEAGILAKHSRVVDLWLVQQIEIDRSAVNRLTQDGTLIFHLVGNKTYTLTGLCRGPELEQAFKKLQDLRFFLRSNPVVKGIVQ
jgi:hypothetical protein